MNITTHKEQISQLNQALVAPAGAPEGSAENAALLEEFSAVLDEIATHVRGNKKSDSDTDSLNYLLAEQAVMPVRVEVLQKPDEVAQDGDEDTDSEESMVEDDEQFYDGQNEQSTVESGQEEQSESKAVVKKGEVRAAQTASSTAGETEVKSEEIVVAPQTLTAVGADAAELLADDAAGATNNPVVQVAQKQQINLKSEGKSFAEQPVVEAAPVSEVVAPQQVVATEQTKDQSSEEKADVDTSATPILQALYAETAAAAASAVNAAIAQFSNQALAGQGGENLATAASREASKGLTSVQNSQSARQDSNILNVRSIENSARADRGVTATKTISRPQAHNILEKVQKALDTAAQARDGKTISVQLDPGNLGKVKVDVSLRDGALHARLSAESPEVGATLREHAHELQSMLRRLGIDVDKVTVSVVSEGSVVHHQSENFTQAEGNNQKSSSDSQQGGRGAASDNQTQPSFVAVPMQGNDVDHWVA